jgi:hypothetical protein
MACDWVARVKFRILYSENGVIKEIYVADPAVVAMWYTHCYDSVQEEIDEWKSRCPDTCIYSGGAWVNETEHDVIFSTTEWGGSRWGTTTHIYTKQQIIRLLEVDFTAITEITAIPFGVQYH